VYYIRHVSEVSKRQVPPLTRTGRLQELWRCKMSLGSGLVGGMRGRRTTRELIEQHSNNGSIGT
jgi:hypothetical protein